MARLTLASYSSAEGLGEGQLTPLRPRHGPQRLSKLELLRSDYQERALREKERKMLQVLTQQQERISLRITGPRALQPPEDKAWASNWTVAKRTAGVDRAHLLEPVYPHSHAIVQRSPSATAATIQPSPPHVRSKSGPSRPDQWQQLEKREMNLEAEIRRKEALLREKLRRTEQELRRIQKEKEQSEWEERAGDIKIRPRRPKLEEGGSGGWKRTTNHRTEATKTIPLSTDQNRGGGERATNHRTEATKTIPLSIDQNRGGGERATNHRTEATKTIPLSIDQNRGGGERATNHRTEATKTIPLSIDQNRGRPTRMEAEDRVLSVVEADPPYGGGRGAGHSAATQGVGTSHQLSLAAPGGQDMACPSSDHLAEETLLHGSVPQDPGQPLAQCQWCGRHFMAQRLHRHAAVCEKSYRSKRKVFDSSKARTKGTDLEPYLHKKGNGNGPSPAPEARVGSWRQTHESFLRTIRQARVVQDVTGRGGRMPERPPPEENPHYVPCPHCSRRFAPRAAERHIPKCENIRSKPRPPPSRR